MQSMEWFSFRATCDGAIWTVYLVDRVPHHGTGLGHGWLRGLTDYNARSVFICANEEKESQDETLFHELMHVAHGPKGGGAYHERQVQRMSPGLYAMLRALGLPSWPRRPNGWRSLITEE